MDGFIVDASVVCSWVLPDEDSPIARRALELLTNTDGAAPDLLWHEVRNVLMLAHRRKRIAFERVIEAMRILRGLSLRTTAPADDQSILTLAERHALTAYDAAYLALALNRQLPLATLDRRLAEAAARESVALL
ncbi:type II toxin-antitoxin system VapC family toxin [Pseudorhizobium endolithicum]|nr:type II toxin-antitoxin system VapC family toxin [Pseudorhizobium endolithicum]